MSQNGPDAKSRGWVPVLAAVVVGVVLGFALGFVARGGGSGAVKVELSDGVSLDGRLDELEKNSVEQVGEVVEKANNQVKDILLSEIKKLIKGKVADLADPPIETFELKNLAGLPVKGAAEPVVTLVEFSDFQCPYCSRMAAALDELVEKHPDKVRLIFVNRPLVSEYRDGFPFHPYAHLAHQAALEAMDQGKFWEFYQYVFNHQKTIFPARPRNEKDYEQKQEEVKNSLVNASDVLGLDKEKMRQSLENGAHEQKLNQQIRLANEMGLHSTPSVFVNGYFKIQNPNSVINLLDSARTIE